MSTWQMTEIWTGLTLLMAVLIFFRLGSILKVLKEIASNKAPAPVNNVYVAPAAPGEQKDEAAQEPAVKSDLLLRTLNASPDAETLRKKLYILTTGGSMTKEETAIVNELMKLPVSEVPAALRAKIGA